MSSKTGRLKNSGPSVAMFFLASYKTPSRIDFFENQSLPAFSALILPSLFNWLILKTALRESRYPSEFQETPQKPSMR
jgi:hypothetical protein